MNRIIISQFQGLGDIIFAQGIANYFIKNGHEVIWPVKSNFIDGVQRAYPNITFIDHTLIKSELFDIKEDCLISEGVRLLPLRWADHIIGGGNKFWMKDKYTMLNLDYKNWKESAIFKRCSEKESFCLKSYGLEIGQKFNLINPLFRTDASRKLNISIDNGLKNIVMDIRDGLSLFDYSLLIETAETIHVANSSIFYLLELLDLSAKEVHIYERTGDEIGFPHVDYLMTKDYILHQTRQ